MKILFTRTAFDEYTMWQEVDRDILKRINELIANARRTPFSGIGKPEPLKGEFAGWWSRRIDREHRLVYRVEGTADAQTLVIAMCRFHYGKH